VKICLNCNKIEELGNVTKRRYDKGDYDKLRKMLEIDWEAKLNCDDVQLQWKTFTNILQEAVDNCIPLSKPKKKNTKHKVTLDEKTLKNIKRKNRLWKEYVDNGNERVYKEYAKVRNQIRRITRKTQKRLEHQLAEDVKQNPKRFWAYVSKRTKIRPSIPNLSKSGKPGEDLTTNDQDKAEVLAEFYSQVFTKEPEGTWQLPEGKIPSEPITYDFSVNAVKKLLNDINPGITWS